jgi:hypothetical protein
VTRRASTKNQARSRPRIAKKAKGAKSTLERGSRQVQEKKGDLIWSKQSVAFFLTVLSQIYATTPSRAPRRRRLFSALRF